MKNNELILSVKFMKDGIELSFLVNKDITLKAMIEALFYGLKRNDDFHFQLFEEYTKKYNQLSILYRAKKELELIEVNKDTLTKKLFELGIVTTSCIQIPSEDNTGDKLTELFPKYDLSALCNTEKLEYNISTRRITITEDSVIDILPPDGLPDKKKKSLWDVLIPTVVSMAAIALSRGIIYLFKDNPAGFSMITMMLATSASTMATQSYNFFKQGKENEKSKEEWKDNYEKYLTRIWNRILDWQKSDINYLCTTYPSIETLFKRTKELNRAIFARSQNDKDFFKIRLGLSEQVEPMFEIKNERKEEIFSEVGYKIQKDNEECRVRIILPPEEKEEVPVKIDNLLTDLPYDLANKHFRYLQAEKTKGLPPLMLDLKNCGALGIVDPYSKSLLEYSHQLVEHIVFELSYYHTPEDLQFVFFFEQENDIKKRLEIIKNYKNLPHVNELFEDSSQFVFDRESAGIVFGKLQAIMGERTKEKSDEEKESKSQEKYVQIVCIIFDDYDIKETGFSKYLPEPPEEGEEYVNTNGLTFIFARNNLALLPRYCGNVIEIVNDTEKGAKLSSRYNILSRETLNKLSTSNFSETETSNIESLIDYKEFKNDYIFYDKNTSDEKVKEYETAFRQLSAVYYRRIAENGNVPSIVTLFELYGYTENNGYTSSSIDEKIKNEIIDNWKKNDVTSNLCVPIGENEHGIVNLDLYEKADGPHMLVAGTTGSGKSETIITYLIGLCMKFSPTYLNLMLVDMKGGGFSDRLRDLPHCVGVVDDTTGESEGISAVYMLKRFLEVLNAEIKVRKMHLKSFGVDNVDAYIKAEKIITKILKGNAKKDAEKALNEAQKEQLEKFRKEGKKEPPTLSHLVLVVDEFTELKRFSSESDDIDFISEITTIARVGRTLGFHIILVSQNIEGAITDDIRINSKSRICLKVATRSASKDMLDGRTDAASPTMPGNGRAYLLVGTGSKFLYFQSAYTGANKDQNIEPVVNMTQIMPCGVHNKNFYISNEHNERILKSADKVDKNDTQLSCIVKLIKEIKKENNYVPPREIFKKPLESKYTDKTKWRESGNVK